MKPKNAAGVGGSLWVIFERAGGSFEQLK